MSELEFTSRLRPAPKVAKLPADLLPERRSCMRRFSQGEAPTIDELVTHASRFGSECVPETAAELGYGVVALTRLIQLCDREDLTRLQKTRPSARLDRRADAEDRACMLLGIERDE